MDDIKLNNPININQTSQGIYEQLNQNFQEQNEKEKSIQEARDILGESAITLTDDQVYALVNEIQYLVDTWVEEYEQQIFDGKTLRDLLQINI